MKILAMISLLLISGCSTVPVGKDFPKVPKELLEKCSQLQKLNDDSKLSDVAKVITNNYTEYHKCSIKNESWIEWYENQKKIYESVK